MLHNSAKWDLDLNLDLNICLLLIKRKNSEHFLRGSISIDRKYKVALPAKTGSPEWKIWNNPNPYLDSVKKNPYSGLRVVWKWSLKDREVGMI